MAASSTSVLKPDALGGGSTLTFQGEDWALERKLGSGRFASVYVCRCASKADKPVIAAKVTTLAGISPWARAQLSEELAIWSTLRHPNVIQLHGSLTDAHRHVLLLELAHGGEVKRAARPNRRQGRSPRALPVREALPAHPARPPAPTPTPPPSPLPPCPPRAQPSTAHRASDAAVRSSSSASSA